MIRRRALNLPFFQDYLEDLRHAFQQEKSQLSSQLAHSEEETRYLKDKISVLERRVAQTSNLTTDEQIVDFMRERTLLERKLEEAHLHLSDIKTSWSGKISSLETQVGRLSRQAGEESLERRRVEEEKEKLKTRVQQLEAELEVKDVVITSKDAKMVRMQENIDEMALELKELQANADSEVEEFSRKIVSYHVR